MVDLICVGRILWSTHRKFIEEAFPDVPQPNLARGMRRLACAGALTVAVAVGADSQEHMGVVYITLATKLCDEGPASPS